jgi:hypothetical protein
MVSSIFFEIYIIGKLGKAHFFQLAVTHKGYTVTEHFAALGKLHPIGPAGFA